MALYLLGKTTLNLSEEIVINGRSIYEHYVHISQILKKHCPAISLAEATITNNKDTQESYISWYADTKTEPVLPLGNQQDFVQRKLAEAMSVLSELYPQGSTERELLQAALSVQSKQDILIADDLIVLKGWGISSANNADTGLSLFSAFAPQQAQEISSAQENSQEAAATKIVSPVTTQTFNTPKAAVGSMGNVSVFLTRLVAGILFFIIGILLGWRLIYAERPTKIAKIPLVEAQDLVSKKPEIDKKNKDLEDEIKKLEEQLKIPPCDLEKSRAAPELNKSLDNSSAPMKSNGKNFQGSLPELLEKSTVFILVRAKDDDGDDVVASGSGFFVTPDMIVTNRHVVENANNNEVLVTNKALGQLKKAHIVSISDHSNDVNSFDLAVLKIEDAPPQQPLSFSLEAQPLQTVVAAGYPGIIIRQDGAMKRLVQGDINAIPGVVLTKGEVNAIQENAKGEKVIPHSASVSPGNSGGELVDLCGRVVGVNTFVTMDSETSSHSNYAQKSDSIVRALQNANIPIQVQSGACKDNVPSGSSEPQKKPEEKPDTAPKDDKKEPVPPNPDTKTDVTKPKDETSSAPQPDQKAEAAKPKEDANPPKKPEQKSDQPSIPHGDKP